MILINIIISTLKFILVCIPFIVVSPLVVGLLLLTSWNGRTTPFGNSKWGRGNNHFSTPTKGYWQEFKWLVWRNPVNNLCSFDLAIEQWAYTINGDPGIGDKTRGGFYRALMVGGWEYYWVRPYGKRCIRVRIGWKINGNDANYYAPFVFSINLWKPYKGV